MRFNQFSYYPVSQQEALQELSNLGFKLDQSNSEKEQFEAGWDSPNYGKNHSKR